MRFIVDAQLPPALSRWLTGKGHQAEHVFDLEFVKASDGMIWTHALKIGATIITKDEDFVILGTMDPEGPPVVWIRIGNTTKAVLLAWFEPLLPMIENGLTAGEKLIEVT